jgi:hypothetical protein
VQGERGIGGCRRYTRDDRGQVIVFFALLLPVLLSLGAVVLAVGNWYTHAKHLQTKVDAAAFAGGAVWGFPCGPDIDANIEAEARMYVGSHTAADGTVVSSPHNPQLSGVGANRIYASLNQAQWWSGSFPAPDFSAPSGSVCQSKVLDVKATQQDAPLLWRYLPFFPDIKKKARVQIEEISGLTGLLPIAVRLPQPLSAAAVFYDEASVGKEILDVVPFRQVCTDSEPTCLLDAPPGLGQWTTEPKAGSGADWARFVARPQTGVVIATSVRPLCGVGTPPATQPCMDMTPTPAWPGRSVDEFCQQASPTVRCYDDVDGGGPLKTVSQGLHFLYGHATGATPPGPNWPELRGAWVESGPLAAGTTCSSPYFVSDPGTCAVELNVKLDAGSCLRGPGGCFNDPAVTPPIETRTTIPQNIEAKYCLVRTGQTGDVCASQFTTAQEMNCTGSSGNVTCRSVPGKHPQITPGSRGNAFAVQIRLKNTAVTAFPACQGTAFLDTCRFFLTGNGFAGTSVRPLAAEVLAEPLHRVFSGDLERTTPVEWLRLTVDVDCDPLTFLFPDRVIGHDYASGTDADAANQPATGAERCYSVDLGVAGGLARDQDEPPIAFNLGDNSSQRAYVDCDPAPGSNLKTEVQNGCQWPPYAANKFAATPYCPGSAGFFDLVNPPMAGWPPYTCVLTQTGNSGQVVQGFNERLFGKSNNPTCPSDDMTTRVPGRNYWHRENNDNDESTFAWDADTPTVESDDWGNELASNDPRLVTLFFTTYESFTNTGNEVYPIVGFGNFYVTGYGEVVSGNWKGGKPEDPCSDGNSSGVVGAGNTPPADIDMSKNTRWVWGHFVKDVTPAPFTTGGSGVLCNPEASFQPCVAVLVE